MRLARAVATATAMLSFVGIAWAEDIKPENVSFENSEVTQSLTGAPGDPAAGAKVFADRKLGNCLACHENSAMPDQLFQGNVGPSLNRIANRRSPDELRAIVANAKEVFGAETVMPGFYTLNVGINVRKDLVGKTILTAQEVEDVVAYLNTLQ